MADPAMPSSPFLGSFYARMRLFALDKTAHYSERIGDFLGGPWHRLSRRAADAWLSEQRERKDG